MFAPSVGLLEQLAQAQHGQRRHGQLGNDKYRRHGPELVVHREVVNHPVGEPHHVVTPRQQHADDGHDEQGPLHRTLDDEASQQEQRTDERADIDRAVGHRLIAEVLRELGENLGILAVHLAGIDHLLHLLDVAQGQHAVVTVLGLDGGATLAVGDEQGEGLVLAIAPLGDIVLVKASLGGLGIDGVLALRGEFAVTAAHGLLGVLISKVQVGRVGGQSQQGGDGQRHRGDAPAAHLLVHDGLDQIGDDQRHDDEHRVVGHLHVVAGQLQGCKEGGNGSATQVLAAIAPHDASNGGRDVGQHHQFPDVAGSHQDEEVTRESIPDGTQHSIVPLDLKGQHQQEEAQQEQENPADRCGEAQAVQDRRRIQIVGALIGRRNLERRHTAEQCARPPRLFAGLSLHQAGLVAVGGTLHDIILLQHVTVHVIGIEINPRDGGKDHHRDHEVDHVGQRQ